MTDKEEKTSKKDIFDYLRNRQKAAEIEAKVNGVNLWVLLGAIGVVTWQLVGNFALDQLNQRELILRALLISDALYLFGWVCGSVGSIRPELRYVGWRAREVESPLLIVMEGTWILLPPLLFIILFDGDRGAAILAVYGFLIVFIGAAAIWSRLMSKSSIEERFPKPEFGQTARSETVGFLAVGASHMYVVATEVQALWALPAPSVELLKSVMLIAALYLLILVAIRRHRSSQGIQWTYELETDLLIGSLSPEAALRRIEIRALGPKLEDVMNRFFEDLDAKFADFDAFMDESEKNAAASLTDVPHNFKFERLGRIQEVVDAARQKIKDLTTDVGQFVEYLEKLVEKKSDARVRVAIQSLTAQGKAYNQRIRSSLERLETLVKGNADTPEKPAP